jgi:hypothetical protein
MQTKPSLAIFVLASLQVLAGMLRPHVPGPGQEKSSVRHAVEMGHCVSGIILLACGFWQMREGIALFAQKYSVSAENEDKLAIAYWVWIAIMAALILVGLASKLANNAEDSTAESSPQATANPEVSVREGEGGTELSRHSTQDARSRWQGILAPPQEPRGALYFSLCLCHSFTEVRIIFVS